MIIKWLLQVWITIFFQICCLYLNYYIECYDCVNPNLPSEDGFYVIPNTQVPTNIENRALLTTPPGFSIRKSNIPNAGLGVFAETTLPKGTRIGPYDGLIFSRRCETCRNRYTWVVYNEDKTVKHYVDGSSKNYSSWLRYVNCANTVDQENVFYYQYNYEVYHVTNKCIKPGMELTVWYGKQYAQLLGINHTSEIYNNKTKRRSVIHSSLSYGPTMKLFEHCYQFVHQSPGPIQNQTKLCRHWKAYITCRYFDCDVNPCTRQRDCGTCKGYCSHAGRYYKPKQAFIGGDHVHKCYCHEDGNIEYEYVLSTFIDMCLYS